MKVFSISLLLSCALFLIGFISLPGKPFVAPIEISWAKSITAMTINVLRDNQIEVVDLKNSFEKVPNPLIFVDSRISQIQVKSDSQITSKDLSVSCPNSSDKLRANIIKSTTQDTKFISTFSSQNELVCYVNGYSFFSLATVCFISIFILIYFVLSFFSRSNKPILDIFFFISFNAIFYFYAKENIVVPLDGIFELTNAMKYRPNPFNHWLMAYLLRGLSLISPRPNFIISFFVLCGSIPLTLIFNRCRENWVSLLTFFLGLVFLFSSPTNRLYFVFLDKCNLFTSVFMLFLLSFYSSSENGKWYQKILLVYGLFILSVFIRFETVAMIPFVILWACVKFATRLKEVLILSASVVLVIYFYFYGNNNMKKYNLNPIYESMVYVNPILDILAVHGVDELNETEQKGLIDIVNLDCAIKSHRAEPEDIRSFNQDECFVQKNINEENLISLRSLFIKLIFLHPETWIKGRMTIVKSMFSSKGLYYLSNDIEGDTRMSFVFPLRMAIQMKDLTRDVPRSEQRIAKIAAESSLNVFYTSSLPALIGLISTILLFRTSSKTILIIFFLMTRTLVVFLLAPAGAYEYILSFVYMGFLLPSLGLVESKKLDIDMTECEREIKKTIY